MTQELVERFPQRYAAASLKLEGQFDSFCLVQGFPQRYAAASLKLR